MTGRIGIWEPETRLQYTWLIEGEQESTVAWQLEDLGTTTRLTLIHRTLPAPMGKRLGTTDSV